MELLEAILFLFKANSFYSTSKDLKVLYEKYTVDMDPEQLMFLKLVITGLFIGILLVIYNNFFS